MTLFHIQFASLYYSTTPKPDFDFISKYRQNRENNTTDGGGSSSQGVLDLQQRTEELEILVGLLRERVLLLEEQNTQGLNDKAGTIAENRRLKSQIEALEHSQPSSRQSTAGHSRTSAAPAGGKVKGSRFMENQELKEGIESDDDGDETNEEEDGLPSDDSVYEETPKKPKARKPSTNNPNKSAKKAKMDNSATTQEQWHADSDDYYKYSCPVDGCDKNLWLHKKHNPTLNAKGEISDQEPWIGTHFNKKIRKMREHMKAFHPDWKEFDWPPGFAKQSRLGKKDNE